MAFRTVLRVRASRLLLALSLATLGDVARAAPAPSPYDAVRKPPAASYVPRRASAPIEPAVNPNVPAQYQYYGGHVISHVQIVSVYWGAGGKKAAPIDSEAYWKALVDSPYMDWLGEYDTAGATVATGNGAGSNQHVNRGTFLEGVTITPSKTDAELQDADVGAELVAQIAAKVLPEPQIDPEGGVNTVFMVYFPTGTYVIGPDGNSVSCNAPANVVAQVNGNQYCGYHGGVTTTVGGKSVNVPFAILPDLNDTGCACATGFCGCGGGQTRDSFMITESHELAEALTDPEVATLVAHGSPIGQPAAWYYQASDPNNPLQGEIADICGNYYRQTNDTAGEYAPMPGAAASQQWIVQNVYSQRLQSCIAQDTSLPDCVATRAASGDAGAKGRRPCKSCGANTDCTSSPSEPACETDITNPAFGTCVACAANADCKVATAPICEKTAASSEDTCRGCKADSECAAPRAKCATTGACVACLADGDCTGTQTCDLTANACVDRPAVPDAGPGGGNGENGGSGTGSSGGCAAAPGGSTASGLVWGGLMLGVAAFARRRRR